MSDSQQTNERYALLQSGLNTVHREHMESLQQLSDVQLKLENSEKRVTELENEKSLLSASKTELQRRIERLDAQYSDLLGQTADLIDDLTKAHETELERATRKAQEEINDLRQRLATSVEQAARVPSLEAQLKECRASVASMRKEAAELSTRSESLCSGIKRALKRINALKKEVNEKTNSFNAVNEESRTNISEGHAGSAPDASSDLGDVMPDSTDAADFTAAPSSAGLTKRPPGRPRKPHDAGPTDAEETIPPKRPRMTRARRSATQMALTAAGVPCCHASCQRPTGENDPIWVTCSRCTQWYHCVCLDETPNHNDWVCGNCPRS